MAKRADDGWTPWVTLAMIAANIAAFGYELSQHVSATSPSAQDLFRVGASLGPVTLHGDWWRLGTAMFLHYGVIHIASNMICLYQARVAERAFGRLGFAAIYIAGGLLGGVASLARSTPVVSAGASGAVFAVYGAFAAFLLVRKADLRAEAQKSNLTSVAVFVVMNLVASLQAGIDMSAHVGGLVAGFAAGVVLAMGSREAMVKRAAIRAAVVLVAGVALTAGGMVVLARRVAAQSPYDFLSEGSRPVIEDFYELDHDTVTTYNAARQKGLDGTLTEAQFADVIEKQLIPKLEAFRSELARTSFATDEIELGKRLDDYVAKDIAAFADLADSVHAQGADQAAQAKYAADRDARDAASKSFSDELNRLHDAP